jgi:hypothetical protein
MSESCGETQQRVLASPDLRIEGGKGGLNRLITAS